MLFRNVVLLVFDDESTDLSLVALAVSRGLAQNRLSLVALLPYLGFYQGSLLGTFRESRSKPSQLLFCICD